MPKYEERICKKHGKQQFVLECHGYFRCTKCRSLAVQRRREKIKELSVKFKGGRCTKCGYDKCIDALEFHHRNPNEKEFGIGSQGYTRGWNRVKKEIEKCDILCANCHREIHHKENQDKKLKQMEEIGLA